MFKVRRPASRRMIRLEVLANARLSPSFVRLTLGGADLAHLEDSGFDQCVRLFFPRPGQDGLWMPTLGNDAWMAQTLMQPKARRPRVRNYTVRAFRPAEQEIDIEFALHDGGPAAEWAAACRPGDPAGIFDEGISYLPPAGAGPQLLVGEESALPAVLAILERSPATLTGEVFLEVPLGEDVRAEVRRPPGVRVTWLPRGKAGGAPGSLALDAVRQAALPSPSYTWAAGEAKLPTGVRRHLVNERGVPKSDIAFIGYWRVGRSAPG